MLHTFFVSFIRIFRISFFPKWTKILLFSYICLFKYSIILLNIWETVKLSDSILYFLFFKNIFKRELHNWFRIKKKQKQIFYRIMYYWATIKKKKNVRKFAWLLTEHVHENDIYCEWRPLPWLIHLSAPQWNSLVLRTRLRE